MFDEEGSEETVAVARENDRVKKDGAKNSHKEKFMMRRRILLTAEIEE